MAKDSKKQQYPSVKEVKLKLKQNRMDKMEE